MPVIGALFDKKCTCQLCGNHFTSKKMRSRFIKCLSYDTDFCPNYTDLEHNPMLYTIYVCPECGYSFSDDFSPVQTTAEKTLLEAKICNNWTPRSYSGQQSIDDAITAFKLAFYCAFLKKEKHIVIAGICLRIAWLHRLQENSPEEQRFMTIALNEYVESYNTLDFLGTQLSELRIIYLLGELSRRIGKTADARKYFSKVIEKQKRSAELGVIEMAKERWREMRNA